MIFSSEIFICVFLPVVVVGYFLLAKIHWKSVHKIQHAFLLFASIVFYGYFKIEYTYIIAASILVNYFAALLCQRLKKEQNKKWSFVCFLVGVLFNILLLGYFKYFSFLRETLNYVFGTSFSFLNILLPLGISFFTFQQLSFVVSIYQGKEKVSSFVDYALFVTFFPQLVAGPIVTYSDMMPQFEDKTHNVFNAENMSKGIYAFAIGLFKKLVIADTIALFVNNGYNLSTYGFAAAWITSISYTIQIYFDFSGYSDMAIGLGYMFNIKLPVNFNSPYKSSSIKEFWSRWHMTLGNALAQFIYVPLGGNRRGTVRTYINLMVTFLISGLWHGAAWTFIIWGALHGIMNVLERVFKSALGRVPVYLRVLGTFIFVNTTWVLFRAPSFSKAVQIFKGMLSPNNLNLSQVSTIVYDGVFTFPLSLNLLLIISMLTAPLFIIFLKNNSAYMIKHFSPNVGKLTFAAALFMICILHLSRLSTFIYFNF